MARVPFAELLKYVDSSIVGHKRLEALSFDAAIFADQNTFSVNEGNEEDARGVEFVA
jgi:hypothetical protein